MAVLKGSSNEHNSIFCIPDAEENFKRFEDLLVTVSQAYVGFDNNHSKSIFNITENHHAGETFVLTLHFFWPPSFFILESPLAGRGTSFVWLHWLYVRQESRRSSASSAAFTTRAQTSVEVDFICNARDNAKKIWRLVQHSRRFATEA